MQEEVTVLVDKSYKCDHNRKILRCYAVYVIMFIVQEKYTEKRGISKIFK